MVTPGISKESLKNLRKEDAEIVKTHLLAVNKAIKRKDDLLEGRVEELIELNRHPRDEVKQIVETIKEVEDSINSELLSDLLALEVKARELAESVDEERALMKDIKPKAIGRTQKSLLKGIEEEMLLASIAEHQLNIIVNIHALAKQIIEIANDLENEILRDKINITATNINDIATFLAQIILREEMPHLKLAFNMLRLEGWPGLKKKIAEIESRFVELEPKLL